MKRRLWFGCPHEFSFPIKSSDGSCYQVCTLCGVEYGYDWKRMKRTKALPRRVQQTSLDQCRPERAPSAADPLPESACGREQEPPVARSTSRAEIWRSAVRLIANAVESRVARAMRWNFSRHPGDAGLLGTPRARRRIRLVPVVVLVVFLAFTYVVAHRSGRVVPEPKSPQAAAPMGVAAHSETSIETAVSNESVSEGTTHPERDRAPRRREEAETHFRCAACSNAGFGRG